jgi:hypothetical protein
MPSEPNAVMQNPMPRNPAVPQFQHTLRPDKDIKTAVFRALQGAGRNLNTLRQVNHVPARDLMALREMIVCHEVGPGTPASQIPDAALPGTEDPFNPIFASVIEFCPIPLPGWQEWAETTLKERSAHWITQLKGVQERLRGARMFASPFGRFSFAEDPKVWVRELAHFTIEAEDIFVDVKQPSKDLVAPQIHYFERPLILWPPERSGAFRHVSKFVANDGSLCSIELIRPEATEINGVLVAPAGRKKA